MAIALGLEPVTADTTSAASQQFSSGTQQVALVELYTSEGCSSCPPADRWISRLKDDPRLWNGLVPLSFHVDYWDGIGWADRFAHPDYSERQRQHVRDGNAGVVYTPGFFSDGKEWRGFFDRQALNVSGPSVGELVLEVNGRDVSVTFQPLAETPDPVLVHVALLGMDLETQVGAGENRGRTLQHDFVVLGLKRRKLSNEAGTFRGELRLPLGVSTQASAIGAWVTGDDELEPLQAVGGYLR
ncbi:MAG: DUF1223 domain-containing protein [Pseudomonadota bacterium]